MNTKLVESLALAIQALSDQERSLPEQKLSFDASEPSTHNLMQLAEVGETFSFLRDEPNLYTAEDGEAIVSPSSKVMLFSLRLEYLEIHYLD